jgi:hypothetical protein
MAQLTPEYIRRRFLEQFAAMTFERREGTLEALTVMHETALAKSQTGEQPEAPLFTEAVSE